MKREHLFRKGKEMLIATGNEPFYLMKLKKTTNISLARLNELKEIFIKECIIKPMKNLDGTESSREIYYGLTEKGRMIQERLVIIDRLIKDD